MHRLYRVTLLSIVLAATGTATCPTPQASSTAYPGDATVNVFLNVSVPDSMAGPIVSAFRNWSNANGNSQGKNASFVFFDTSHSQQQDYAYVVVVSTGIYQDTAGNQDPNIGAYTSFSNGASTTTFYLGSNAFDQNAQSFSSGVLKTMMHEIGHVMGLKDQPPPQNALESVMNYGVNANDSGNNLPSDVTTCDNQGVRNAYAGGGGQGSGSGGTGGYTTYVYEYTTEDDSEGGCACYTTYEVTDYYYNGVWQYSTQSEVAYWCTC